MILKKTSWWNNLRASLCKTPKNMWLYPSVSFITFLYSCVCKVELFCSYFSPSSLYCLSTFNPPDHVIPTPISEPLVNILNPTITATEIQLLRFIHLLQLSYTSALDVQRLYSSADAKEGGAKFDGWTHANGTQPTSAKRLL